jgi:protein-arginine kinase activator protein McsA
MDNEKTTEPCYKCEAHFNRSQMQKLEIFNSPINLYICNNCSNNTKEQLKSDEGSIKKVELFI